MGISLNYPAEYVKLCWNPNEGNHRTLVTVCGESFLDMPIVWLFGLACLTIVRVIESELRMNLCDAKI